MLSNVMSQQTQGAAFPGYGGVNGIQSLVVSNGSLGGMPTWNGPMSFSSLFEEFATNLINVNIPMGELGWYPVSSGNGIIDGSNANNPTPGSANRFGVLGLNTGNITNNTGLAALWLQSTQTYVGQVKTFTMQWSAQMPGALGTSLVAYTVDMGLESYPYPGQNGMLIRYAGTTSTINFQAITSNNGTATTINPVGSSFAVGASTWYNFMIQVPASGASGVNFYISAIGGTYVLMGNSTTNLPDVNDQCYPTFAMYKGSSFGTANQRIFWVDWCKMDCELSR